VSPILLATNSKTGIFGIFPKEERKCVTFKMGILGGPAIKVTKKVKLHEGRPTNLVSLMQLSLINFKVLK